MDRDELVIIGIRVKRHILKKYPSIEKFCFENAIPKKTVSNIINGQRDTRILTMMKVVKALEITMNDVVDLR